MTSTTTTSTSTSTTSTSTSTTSTSSTSTSTTGPQCFGCDVFRDDFNDGTVDAWDGSATGNGGVFSLVTSPVHHGGYAAKGTDTQFGGYALTSKTLGANYSHLFFKAHYRFEDDLPNANGEYITIVKFRDLTRWEDKTNVEIRHDGSNLRWQLEDINGATTDRGNSAIAVNTWYCVQVEIDLINGIFRLFIDGSLECIIRGGTTYGSVGYIYVGLANSNKGVADTFTVYWDCVCLDDDCRPTCDGDLFTTTTSTSTTSTSTTGSSTTSTSSTSTSTTSTTSTSTSTTSTSTSTTGSSTTSTSTSSTSTTSTSTSTTGTGSTSTSTSSTSTTSTLPPCTRAICLYPNGFDSSDTDFGKVGNSPYLTWGLSDTVFEREAGGEIGNFDFENTAQVGTPTTVEIALYCKRVSAGVTVTINIWDGVGWIDVGAITPDTTVGWKLIDVSAVLDTFTKINAARMSLVYNEA